MFRHKSDRNRYYALFARDCAIQTLCARERRYRLCEFGTNQFAGNTPASVLENSSVCDLQERGDLCGTFMNSYWNYAIVGAGFLFALVGYFITLLCFRRKNAKEWNGGAVEYEFI